jgi:hypothetical protein
LSWQKLLEQSPPPLHGEPEPAGAQTLLTQFPLQQSASVAHGGGALLGSMDTHPQTLPLQNPLPQSPPDPHGPPGLFLTQVPLLQTWLQQSVSWTQESPAVTHAHFPVSVLQNLLQQSPPSWHGAPTRAHGPLAAAAGLPIDMMTGADQATALAMPIRRSASRRPMPRPLA